LGWGLAPGYPSSIVNTSEALFVLAHAGRLLECATSVEYITKNLERHRDKYGARIRYTAFAMLGLKSCKTIGLDTFISSQREWLLKARNQDGGWGHTASDQNSHLLPTSLAVEALRGIGQDESAFEDTYRWLLSRFAIDGWSFPAEEQANPVATAYALLSLASSKYRDHSCVRQGESLLLNTRHWGVYDEGIPGAVWRHCTYPWVLGALIALGHNPFSPVMAEGIRYINSLRDKNGGWNEMIGQDTRTVRSQYWAVYAYSAIISGFDPENDVPRIDADRTTKALTEPDFVRVLVHTSWASVIPARLYRTGAYTLAIVAVSFLFGCERLLSQLPPRVDAAVAAALGFAAFTLVRKRRRYFPRVGWMVANIIFGGLVLLNLITGASLASDVLTFKLLITKTFAGAVNVLVKGIHEVLR
jgi:hypothetical protein